VSIVFVKKGGKYNVTIEDMVAESDKVVVRFTYRGTHTGELMGVAPTGKKVSQAGINIFRIAGGKVAEAWAVHDTFGLMQQLGAIPSQ
jgi:predicted ester cyclase